MTENNTIDNNVRIAELLSQLFLKAAEDAADKSAVGQDSIEELVNTTVNEAMKANMDAWANERVEEIVYDRVESALDDRIGYDELITEGNFNDYLEDSDVLRNLVSEDFVEDAMMHATNDLEAQFITTERMHEIIEDTTVTQEVVNQMMLELELDLEAAKLSTRLKMQLDKLFTLTKHALRLPYQKLRNLTKLRLTTANTNKGANNA